ncbi:hypothetical protein BG004_007941 [Podila humilis]|nr:hypothetical protein BG004_007941 [Podila humilis]
MPRGGVTTPAYDGQVHAFIGFNSKRKLTCNGYPRGPVTVMNAGEVINVRFWGPTLGKNNKLPSRPSPKNKELNQARHGGGTCQFSLSSDGGKTYHLIGEYTRSCPDFYYTWPVKIPDNVPSCNKRGQCLFVWTWTAVNVPQFYQNCADIVLRGKQKGGSYPKKGIKIVDVKGYPQNVRVPGDGYDDNMGKGPISSERQRNLKGNWL